jgi:hypothetical protein
VQVTEERIFFHVASHSTTYDYISAIAAGVCNYRLGCYKRNTQSLDFALNIISTEVKAAMGTELEECKAHLHTCFSKSDIF